MLLKMEELLNIFRATTPNYTALFGKLFCGTFAFVIAINFNDQLHYFRTKPERIYGQPQKLLGIFRLPTLTESQFIVSGCVLILSLLATALGIAVKPAILTALVCYFIYFNAIRSLAYIQRKTNMAAIVLIVLAVSPSISNTLKGTGTLWEMLLIKIAVAQMYFSAGLHKITRGSKAWMSGEVLQMHLLENHLWSDNKIGFRLAENQRLCAFLGTATLVFELSFWLIIVFPQLTYFYVTAALLFHIGTFLTMRINYLIYLSPVYFVFFTQELFDLVNRLGL
jgi:hypothetical protein